MVSPECEQPGYRHFFIKPRSGGSLTWVQGSYKSIHGEIASKWKMETNGVLTMNITIPANATADTSIPRLNEAGDWVVRESKVICRRSGAHVGSVPGLMNDKDDGKCVTLKVGSGEYSFQSGRLEPVKSSHQQKGSRR